MPEPRIIPAGRALRAVALPPGTLEDIQVRARRRRTGRVAAVGSATLTVVALVAVSGLVGHLDQRDDSLQIGPATGDAVVPGPQLPPPAGSAVTVPAPPRHEPSSRSTAPASQVRQQVPEAPAPAAAPPVAAAEPAPSEAVPQRRQRFDPDATRDHQGIIVLPPECEQTGRGSFGGWCLQSMAGVADEIIFSACRARGYGAARLEWATSQQVRLEVRDARDRVVWRYDPRVRPDPSSEHVAAEECRSWRVPWALVDEQGKPLPSGDYTLHAASSAASLQSVWVSDDFTVGDAGDPLTGSPAPGCAPQTRVPGVIGIC